MKPLPHPPHHGLRWAASRFLLNQGESTISRPSELPLTGSKPRAGPQTSYLRNGKAGVNAPTNPMIMKMM